MSNGRNYNRERNGKRFILAGGLDTVHPLDVIPEGSYPYLQNVRANIKGRIVGRPTMGDALFTLAAPPHTIVRLNDTSPNGPAAGYVRVIGAAGAMYVNATAVASGFSGNPLAILPFGPDQSVQPWAYVGDPSQAVTIAATGQSCTGMVKVRSDGLTYKTGIKEPQVPPVVGNSSTQTSGIDSLPNTAMPWTNRGGQNATWNFGGTEVTSDTDPIIIATPIAGSTLTLGVTGTATVNGATHGPGDSGPITSGYPGLYLLGGGPAKIVLGAFTDGSGNVIAPAANPSAGYIYNVGTAVTLTVPQGAIQFQMGVDSQGGNFAANAPGSFTVNWTLLTPAVTNVLSTFGVVTAYIWDNTQSGDGGAAGATYDWKNPSDSGTAISETVDTAAVVTTNNSLLIDYPNPGNDLIAPEWTTLNADGTVAGAVELYSTPLYTNQRFSEFHANLVGAFYVPTAGAYDFFIDNMYVVMFGVGGGATPSNGSGEYLGTTNPFYGQTMTVISGLPLMAVCNWPGTNQTRVTVTFPNPGVYPFELDWAYWYQNEGRNPRQFGVLASPTPGTAVANIPPLAGVRINSQYWCKYRSSATGAQSNESPGSVIQIAPTVANSVSSAWSPDPQVDKVDYYRQDQGLANPTYVATGPNDNAVAGGFNTPIVDVLTDLAVATNQIMQTDDFEPFPSIDVPKAGVVNVVGGTITWVSGDKFDVRWLPGTEILIGSPTQIAYSFYQRPLDTTHIYIPEVPSGNNLVYNIAQPILAQQPIASLWGPDAYGFMHGCGDPNQPGAYLWTKAYNPDSAPDTNRLQLSSESEALMGGGIVNGVSMVFSPLRSWNMYPNFADAQATTEGIVGTPWTPAPATTKRGLFIRNCLCSLGGKAIAFRAPDGICITSGGSEQSLTDERLYNLFPHEGFTPQPVQIGPATVYPPNDSLPQTLTYQSGYIYYDYTATYTEIVHGRPVTVNAPQTLVYDEAAKGWSVDIGNPVFTAHSVDYGASSGIPTSDTAVGCADGTVRTLQAFGTESVASIVATGADNAGDARALKRLGDVFIKALIEASNPIALAFYSAQYESSVAGLLPTSLTGTGVLAPYIVDGAGAAIDLLDLAMVLSWPTGSGNELDLWQPVLMPLPAAILSRRTDGISVGRGYQHVYLVNMTFAATAPVTLTLNTDQGKFTQTWPASGTLAVLTRVMEKMPPNKFKVCEYEVTSTAPFYLFDMEIWVGIWGRSDAYTVIRPFTVPEAGL